MRFNSTVAGCGARSETERDARHSHERLSLLKTWFSWRALMLQARTHTLAADDDRSAVGSCQTRCDTVITVPTTTRIVRIGNSRGIRIPKSLLDEADLPDEVELHARPGRLVVQAARRPRNGWAAAAKRMRARGDDVLLDESTATKFDREEWKWR